MVATCGGSFNMLAWSTVMFKVSALAGRKPMTAPTSAKKSAEAKTAHRLARRPNTADIDISRTLPATATATAERGHVAI
jgi:hypothetical protein